MLKHQSTYEIMLPETVGLSQSSLVLGKHSGRHAFRVHLQEMGFQLNKDELDRTFKRFKSLADKKKTITDADLEALLTDELYQSRQIFSLDGLQVTCGTMGLPTATVRLLEEDGEIHISAAVGTGPVDAAYKAIDTIAHAPNMLLEFSVHAVTEGIDAQGEVTVRIRPRDGDSVTHAQRNGDLPRTYGGYGADTDIIVASVKAYLAAINKLLTAEGNSSEVQNLTPVDAAAEA
jgi:2-isopropylmalate synthase